MSEMKQNSKFKSMGNIQSCSCRANHHELSYSQASG